MKKILIIFIATMFTMFTMFILINFVLIIKNNIITKNDAINKIDTPDIIVIYYDQPKEQIILQEKVKITIEYYNQDKGNEQDGDNKTLSENKIEKSSNRWNINLTDEEKSLLARIVHLEAGNQSSLGKEAVIEVIFNRIYSDVYPNTLVEVLSQKGQFSTWKNRNSNKATPTESTYECINNVLNGNTDILPYKTMYFGTSAHSNRIEVVIEDHVFTNQK